MRLNEIEKNPFEKLTDDEVYQLKMKAVVSQETARVSFGRTRSVKAGERYRKATAKVNALAAELRRRNLPIRRGG